MGMIQPEVRRRLENAAMKITPKILSQESDHGSVDEILEVDEHIPDGSQSKDQGDKVKQANLVSLATSLLWGNRERSR